MDRRERSSEASTAFIAMLQGFQSGLWTSLPGYVVDFDPEAQTATIQVPLLFSMQQPDGSFKTEQMKPLPDVLVQFPKGGGCALTFPLKAGDEGFVTFSARCLDAWWQNGGIQAQAELRMHDLSDGFFVPGISSVPQVFPAISTREVQLRNKRGDAFYALDPETGAARIFAPGGLTIVADIEHTGSQHSSGEIVSDTEVSVGEIALSTHGHEGVIPGPGDTLGPIPL